MSWTKVRSEIALYRKKHPDLPIPIEMYQDLKAERLSAEVQRVLTTAPPLTPEQRAKIAARSWPHQSAEMSDEPRT